jgi:hypothetical protein
MSSALYAFAQLKRQALRGRSCLRGRRRKGELDDCVAHDAGSGRCVNGESDHGPPLVDRFLEHLGKDPAKALRNLQRSAFGVAAVERLHLKRVRSLQGPPICRLIPHSDNISGSLFLGQSPRVPLRPCLAARASERCVSRA